MAEQGRTDGRRTPKQPPANPGRNYHGYHPQVRHVEVKQRPDPTRKAPNAKSK
jgi:hypothetical protein